VRGAPNTFLAFFFGAGSGPGSAELRFLGTCEREPLGSWVVVTQLAADAVTGARAPIVLTCGGSSGGGSSPKMVTRGMGSPSPFSSSPCLTMNFVSRMPSSRRVRGKFLFSTSSSAASHKLMRSIAKLGLYAFLPGGCCWISKGQNGSRRRELELEHVLYVLDPVIQVLVDAREDLQHLAALQPHEATHVDDHTRAQLLLDARAEARDRLLLGRVATHECVSRALQEVFEGRSLVTCEAAWEAHHRHGHLPYRTRRRV
jgi:hypothetical protein